MREGWITTSTKEHIEETIIESSVGMVDLWAKAAEHCGLTVNDFTDGRLRELPPEMYCASRRGMKMLGVRHGSQVFAHNITITNPATNMLRISLYLTQPKGGELPHRLAITTVEHGGKREGAGRKAADPAAPRNVQVGFRTTEENAEYVKGQGGSEFLHNLVTETKKKRTENS